LDTPGADGAVAAIDRLTIAVPNAANPPTISGVNTGQHGK